MAAITVNTITLEAPGEFDPWPAPGAAAAIYDQKAWDSGTAGWCYYSLSQVTGTPAAIDTVPNYTGTLSNAIVVGVRAAP